MFPSGVFDNIHPTSTGQPLAKIIQDCLRYIDLKSLNRHLVLPRSEEHTSELQSPCNLVCRLLLEKKKLGFDHTEVNYRALYALGSAAFHDRQQRVHPWRDGPQAAGVPRVHGLRTGTSELSITRVY